MKISFASYGLLLALVPSSGCDSLTARPFAGAVVQLSLQGTQPNAPGEHFELWAANQYGDVLRIDGIYDVIDPRSQAKLHSFFGFVVRPAITMGDPCMIDGEGNLLVTPDAYPKTVTVAGVTQTPAEQAAQVRARISQVVGTNDCDGSPQPTDATQLANWKKSHCGREQATLLTVVPYDATPLPDAYKQLTFATPADQRLAACRVYWMSPLAYTPNPAQLTSPAHGTQWGYIAYATTSPPAGYDGIRIDTPVGLKGINELWLTTEASATVDGKRRGPVYVDGKVGLGGNDILHFDLTPPAGSSLAVTGTAAVNADLDTDPVQF